MRVVVGSVALLVLAACSDAQTGGSPATGPGQQYAAQGGGPYAGYAPQGYAQGAPQEDCMAMGNQGATMPTGPISAEEAMSMVQGDQARLQAMEACVYRNAARDPRIRADWERVRAQGDPRSLEQFAMWHAQTTGGTRTGEWNASQRQIQAQQVQAMRDYMAGRPGSVFDPRSNDYRSAAAGANHLGMQIVRGQDGRCYYQAYMEAGVPYQGGQAPCPPNG